METQIQVNEKKRSNRALIISLFVHAGALLLLFINFAFNEIEPEENNGGIEVNLGFVDYASGDIIPTTDVLSEVTQVNSEDASSSNSEDNAITQNYEETVNMNQAENNSNSAVDNNSNSDDNSDSKNQQTVSPELQAMLDKMKNGSQGITQGSGDQGAPNGDPNSDHYGPDGPGKGDKGFGWDLSGRGIVYVPPVENNSQKYGKVVIKIKVDRDGKVVEASYQSLGSNTSDSYLVDQAKKAAKQAKFSEHSTGQEYQYGTITINFKLK